MEFELKTNLEQGLQVIDFNYEALKAGLVEKIEKYKGLVVQPNDIPIAKADKANLNRLKTALDDCRKDTKKRYMKPFEDFETKMKELIGMVDEPVRGIDKQIKAYEQTVKDEKKTAIQAFYEAQIGELSELLPLSRLWDERWLNAGFKMSEIETFITETIKKTNDNVRLIQVMKTPFEQEVLSVLFRTLDMSAALSKKVDLEEQAERMKALQVKIDAERAEREQRRAEEAEKLQAVCPEEPVESPSFTQVPVFHVSHEEMVQEIDFRVYVTETQKKALRAFFINNNIKYGFVPKED